MHPKSTLKLYVNGVFVTQRRANTQGLMKEIIERWKRMYALEKHEFKIYIQHPSKMIDN